MTTIRLRSRYDLRSRSRLRLQCECVQLFLVNSHLHYITQFFRPVSATADGPPELTNFNEFSYEQNYCKQKLCTFITWPSKPESDLHTRDSSTHVQHHTCTAAASPPSLVPLLPCSSFPSLPSCPFPCPLHSSPPRSGGATHSRIQAGQARGTRPRGAL